ncbi:MAG: hypothetical protein KME20_19370 [Kaiparowitsia implicata GSE-PSE-MK54-09C]|jgi:hypothetical protein|nr:hypothetical protein [Kaiparowitsia implicata GSE-PSE-MK54-09C]
MKITHGNLSSLGAYLEQIGLARLRAIAPVNSPAHQLADIVAIAPKTASPRLVRTQTHVIYEWAIAYHLSLLLPHSAETVARAIALTLQPSHSAIPSDDASQGKDAAASLERTLWSSCQITQQRSALIQIAVGDCGLAAWLQHCLQTPPLHLAVTTATPPSPAQILPLQLTHARVCALLRLGHRANLIHLGGRSHQYPIGVIQQPHPLPWRSPAGVFWGQHPAERHLLHTVLALQDRLRCCIPQSPKPENGTAIPQIAIPQIAISQDDALRWAMLLSHAVEQLDRDCRLMGEAERHTPALAQMRLGLLAIAQPWLMRLLEDGLQATAPTEA